MKKTKTLFIIITAVETLIIIALGCLLMFKKTEPTKGLLDRFIGEYQIKSTMYSAYPGFLSEPDKIEDEIDYIFPQNKVYIGKDRVEIPDDVANGGNRFASTNWEYVMCYKNPKYKVQKITPNFLENDVYSQGLMLKHNGKGIIPSVEALNKLKETPYVIFFQKAAQTNGIKEEFDESVFFYIDGEYYLSIHYNLYKLEKLR